MTPPPALVFDFGNVIAFFDYAIACAPLGERLGLSGEELLAQARKDGLTELVVEYERGRLTTEEFGAAARRLVRLESISHDEFVTAWTAIFRLNESVARLIPLLKTAGYTLVLGSNTNDLHARHFRPKFAETLGHFDALVMSHEVGHVKPSVEFYQACAQAAGRPLGECIFIDDLPENVAGARAAGMSAILYRDTPALLEEFSRLGIRVPTD
jgi:putative hydrolase of the HAD superfamily